MTKRRRNASHIYSGEVKPVSTVFDAIHLVAPPTKRQKTRVVQKSFGTHKRADTEISTPTTLQESLTPPVTPAAPDPVESASLDPPEPPPKKVSTFLLTLNWY